MSSWVILPVMAEDDAHPPLPPLYHACMANDLALVQKLLEDGADPDDGESVYHSAQRNLRGCLELLRAHGAELSERHAKYGNTPLYFLAGHREGDTLAATAVLGMTWLLEHGADPNVTSYEMQETPLHAIARNGWSPPLAALLIAHGADINAERTDGRNAYAIAVRSGNAVLAAYLLGEGATTQDIGPADVFLGACLRGDDKAARALLAAHPSLIESLPEEDRGGIVHAVYAGNEAAVRLMADLGFDLAAEGAWAGTPLHHAAWLGRAGMVRLLVAKGAPLDAKDSRYGSSPLGWAAHASAHNDDPTADPLAVVSILLDAGSDRTASINRWGEAPEQLASPAVQQLLRARGFAP